MIRYIFSINTGRSGSHYLSEVFKHVEGCVSEHEPKPKMNAEAMQEYLAGRPRKLERLMQPKIEAIEAARGDQIYVETNHCYIKGFGWLMPKYIPQKRLGVIILRRDPAKIRQSFTRVLCSPFLKSGDNWIITPAAKQTLVPLPEGFSFPVMRFHAYRLLSRTLGRPGVVRRLSGGRMNLLPMVRRYERSLLDWYIAETDARAELYKRTFPNITYVEADLDELNTIEGVTAMLEPFGLRPKPSLAEVVGRATNQRAHKVALADTELAG